MDAVEIKWYYFFKKIGENNKNTLNIIIKKNYQQTNSTILTSLPLWR